jgi:hypothetical protein
VRIADNSLPPVARTIIFGNPGWLRSLRI